MSRDKQRLLDYLGHILCAIDRIERYTGDADEVRNAVAHGYFKVDLEIVWKTIQNELADFHAQVSAALQDLSGNV